MNTTYLEILQIHNDIKKSLTSLVQATSKIQQKQAQAEPSTNNLIGDSALSSAVSTENVIQRGKREFLGRLAQIKIECTRLNTPGNDEASIRIDNRPPLNNELYYTSFGYDANDMQPVPPRVSAVYRGHAVWVEWKDSAPGHTPATDPTGSMVERRIQMLTELLRNKMPTGFRALPCSGYVKPDENENQYGLVFEKPPVVDPHMRLVTLQELLVSHARPSLSARVNLAAVLAESIYTFHAVNWLYKGMRSDNIIFFTSGTELPALGSPYVSGFELSRPTQVADMTERPDFNPSQDIYRHPYAQSTQVGKEFRKSYDLYSLGVVLMEIASWRRIEKILAIDRLEKTRPSDLINVRQRLLGHSNSPGRKGDNADQYLHAVAGEVGDIYQNVVKLCLQADEIECPTYDGETPISISVRLQRMMEREILKPLWVMERALNCNPDSLDQ